MKPITRHLARAATLAALFLLATADDVQAQKSGGKTKTPIVTTTAATNQDLESATLTGTVNPNGLAVSAIAFRWGTVSGSLGNSLTGNPSSLRSTAGLTSVIGNLSGLACGTTYHYQLSATYGAGQTVSGSQTSFSTSACPVPVVSTGAATNVDPAGAQLNATVNPNGAAVTAISFEWGTSSGIYPNSVPATPASLARNAGATAVSAALAGLNCNTAYVYRVSASYGTGASIQGSESRFVTDVCPPLSLKDVPARLPTNLQAFLRGAPGSAEAASAQRAAITLGKALFWDMQVGSDNVQACAACHFNAGADNRSQNQIDPGFQADGAPDTVFGNSAVNGVPGPNDAPWRYGFGPNFPLESRHFPLHRRGQPTLPGDGLTSSDLLMDTNDVVSSMGVRLGDSLRSDPRDPIFNWKGVNVRRSATRNAPSAINAVFHLDMFWDGRGSFIFNGMTPFGFRDTVSKVKRWNGTAVEEVTVRIPYAAHASQSVGPPLSSREQSGHARNFTDLAIKLLNPNLVPLGRQIVHPQDSVLGSLSRASVDRRGRLGGAPGLNTTYRSLIEQAFRPEWYTGNLLSSVSGTMPSTVIEHNFPLFFGLASLLYQATLIADDTPFDRFMGANANVRGNGQPIAPDPNALTVQEQRGLSLFTGEGRCTVCHMLPETSNHVIRLAGAQLVRGGPTDPVNVVVPGTVLELMPMGNGGLGVYDLGMYNIGVRPTEEDVGRANHAPPPAGAEQGLPLSYSELALLKVQGQLPAAVAEFVPGTGADDTGVVRSIEELFRLANNRVVTRGAFKTPIVRNQAWQGPYFHNGGDATLRHVIEFYTRGGNFPQTNAEHLDADIAFIPELDVSAGNPLAEENIRALVAFLNRGLTDLRVINRQAPFDHPQLFVPVGQGTSGTNPDQFMEITATGASGGTAITRFLNLDPQSR